MHTLVLDDEELTIVRNALEVHHDILSDTIGDVLPNDLHPHNSRGLAPSEKICVEVSVGELRQGWEDFDKQVTAVLACERALTKARIA